jgi:crossover junction endodeoxyribonuclease RuvC
MKVFNGGLDLSDDRPVYMGIDQSYSGFAITLLREDGYFTTVYKSDVRGIDRLKDIQAHLMERLVQHHIKDVALEGYAFGSHMANMLGELGGMVKLTLLDFGIYPLIVPPTNLKKYVTGKGNTPKSQMMLQVYKTWRAEFDDDNAADSFALAKLVSGSHKFEYQKEVYDKLQDPKFREK